MTACPSLDTLIRGVLGLGGVGLSGVGLCEVSLSWMERVRARARARAREMPLAILWIGRCK